MAATDQHYRNQKTLDVVFGVSCLLMLISVIWMFVQDYNREFKKIQREFRDVEAALNERAMLNRLPSKDEVDARLKAVDAARAALTAVRDTVAKDARAIQAKRDTQNARAQSLKADFDAKASRVVQTRDALSVAKGADVARLTQIKADQEKELEKLGAELEAAQKNLEEIDANYKKNIRESPRKVTYKDPEGKDVEKTISLKDTEEALSNAEDDLKKVTGEFDRYAKTTAQKTWKFGDTFRNWPILDAFAAPTKISQIVLPELTIDYSFKEVPRYDRCTTCHLGIDRAMFDRDALRALGHSPKGLEEKRQLAHDMLNKRAKSGENLGFDVSDLPQEVRTKKLSRGQVTMYASHPRLDLFVEANSPHPMQQFGCTICHSGQGSATEFVLASHSPADFHQEHEWEKNYSWKSIHYWDFPMYSSRFTESSCLKCHHQVTDLVRYGSKQEAPKLLRGYELVRENGCFGCHEIAGTKSGRPIGPDLRLEPTPPLDWMTPSEQDKVKSDPLNPPGTYRKVGPSLRRLAEKTNQEWTRKWIASPRGFREDTKMPHFYGLSTNSREALKKDREDREKATGKADPVPQDDFPDAEIHAIAYYLLAESKGHFDYAKDPAKDGSTARRILRQSHQRLQAALTEKGLTEKEKKDLDDVTKALTDFALLSVPAKAAEINTASAEVRRLQERWYEHGKLAARKKRLDAIANPKESEQAELESIDRSLADLRRELKGDDTDKLAAATLKLGELAKPVPISEKVLTVDGTEASLKLLDAKVTDDSREKGRTLFTERGCLACHSHDGTERQGKMSVAGEANFGPNLSRIAAKIKPELGNDARRWLFQWILNPNIHHPRTRMPVTRLTEEEARDVADWLLSQKATGWDENDPVDHDNKVLRRLARVYLAKAPGMTRADVEKVLPESGDDIGFDADRLAYFPPDAEEHRLRKTESKRVSDDDLKWYIGKKSISRMGCYGCHDVPGFEQAKPIGTALNDWGKKDAERLAFEDGDSFVREHFNIVPSRLTKADLEALIAKKDREGRVEQLKTKLKKDADNFTDLDRWELRDLTVPDPKDPEEDLKREIRDPLTEVEKDEIKELKERLKNDAPWGFKDGKAPYEKHSFDALEHHTREGFLHLKLSDPRSYDYNRTRAWDDRLRMPQFQFARSRQHKDESDEDYPVRQTQEEADAREAVMTFILGLTAENISPKYIYKPAADRHAEVKGRQLLEKYNCTGCHQVRSSVFEFKLSPELRQQLAAKADRSDRDKAAHTFPGHSAWTGVTPAAADRLMAFANYNPGYNPKTKAQALRGGHPVDELGRYDLRLNEALRFSDPSGVMRDLPSANTFALPLPDIGWSSDQYGGKFVELLVPYLLYSGDETIKESANARELLPPPLLREGERVQPNWLYSFLLKPTRVRPNVRPNMPRFNMSPEEATALVDYFMAVERLTNPAAGSGTAHVTVAQQDPAYWHGRTPGYVAALKKDKDRLDTRIKSLEPMWKLVLEEEAQAAKRHRQKLEDDLKKDMTNEVLKAGLAAAKKAEEEADKKFKAGDTKDLKTDYEADEAYAADGLRLLLGVQTRACLGCHDIVWKGDGALKGPPLYLAGPRLRPEWTRRWIANPKAMFSYDTAMLAIIENNKMDFQSLFVGTPLEQVSAIRDVLMDLSRVAALPANRYFHMAPAGGKQ
jgi:mono/diheme cytochrome c family protein